jgi:agmatinase
MEERLIAEGITSPQAFAGLPPEHSNWERARVAIIPVPYDLTASYRSGARLGPQAILEASRQLELYDEELGMEPYRVGICTLPPLEPAAAGPEQMIARVERVVSEVLATGKLPLLLGGDHSITLGAVRALTSSERLSVLQLDAHADMRDEYQGTKWSHACVGCRIGELAGLVQLGVRSLSREEAEFLKGSEITMITARSLLEDPRPAERAIDELADPLYITVDLDIFDPALMPAVGTPEPGGLDWQMVLALLRHAFETRRVVGCDLVELAPIPGLSAPDYLAAKLVYKMIGYWSLNL